MFSLKRYIKRRSGNCDCTFQFNSIYRWKTVNFIEYFVSMFLVLSEKYKDFIQIIKHDKLKIAKLSPCPNSNRLNKL